MNIQDYERLIIRINDLEQRLSAVSQRKMSQGSSTNHQRIFPGKVYADNGDGSYQVQRLAGVRRAATEHILRCVVPANPDDTFSVDDYVTVVQNAAFPHYIIGASGAGGSGETSIYYCGWTANAS